MDINSLRGLSTILVMVAFLGICIWVYVIKSKKDFDEAANLPFADEQDSPEKPSEKASEGKATEE